MTAGENIEVKALDGFVRFDPLCHENPDRGPSLHGLGIHVVPHRSQSINESLFSTVVQKSIEVVAAEILVTNTCFQHFIDRLEDAVCDRNSRTLLASPSRNSPKTRFQVGRF